MATVAYYLGTAQADGTSLDSTVTDIANNGNSSDTYEIFLYDGLTDLTEDITWPADRDIRVYGSEHMKAGNDKFDATWTFPQDTNVIINGVWMETSTADKNLVVLTSGTATTGYQQFIGCRFLSPVSNATSGGATVEFDYAGIINTSFTCCLFQHTGTSGATNSHCIRTQGVAGAGNNGILNLNNCVFLDYHHDVYLATNDLLNTRFCVSDCLDYHSSQLNDINYVASFHGNEIRYTGDPSPATRVKGMYAEDNDIGYSFLDYEGATRDNIYQYLIDWRTYWVGPEGSTNNAISDLGSITSGQPAADLYFTIANDRGDLAYCDPIGNFFTSTDGDASNPNGWFRGCWSLATMEEYMPVKFPGEGTSIGVAGRAWTDIHNGNYDSDFFVSKKDSQYAALTQGKYRASAVDPEGIGYAVPTPGRVTNNKLPPNRS